MKGLQPDQLAIITAILTLVAIPTISFFLKKQYERVTQLEKVNQDQDRAINFLEREVALLQRDNADLRRDLQRNEDQDNKRWDKVSNYLDQSKNEFSTLNQRISQQNKILIVIAEKLGVDKLVSDMLND